MLIGGSSGIGLALAQQLANAGANVWVAARNRRELPSHSNIHFHTLDILSESPDFGFLPPVLHGLVYCPGSITLKPFHRLTQEDFRKDFQLNVLGAVQCIQACLKALKKGKSSSIVLFSTVAATTGMAFHASIATAKAGVEGLTKSLAAEFAPKIRVNAIAPSLTDTPLAERLLSTEDKRKASAKRHPMNRVGTAEELAKVALLLLSEDLSWITGQVLGVDGGMSTLRGL